MRPVIGGVLRILPVMLFGSLPFRDQGDDKRRFFIGTVLRLWLPVCWQCRKNCRRIRSPAI